MAPRSGPSGPDAVVIGAGPNGLVAANLLADAGWEVVVLEAAPVPGGAVRSDRSVHPDFVTDLFSAFYPLALASPVIRSLELERWGLRWRFAPAPLAHVLPDDRCALLSPDLARTMASVDAFAPGDGAAWESMVTEYEELQDQIIAALLRPFPPVVPGLRLLHRLGTGGTLRFARMALQSARRLGAERFRGEGAPLLIAGNAQHTDLPPEAAGSGFFGWFLAMLGQTVGFPVPEGGAGALTDALVARLTAAGGTVRTSERVEQVLVTDGTAVGVRTAGGEVVHARRAVLADTSAPALYRDLVGEKYLPTLLVSDLEKFHWDDGTVKVNWALSGPIPWTARDAGEAGTVHLGVDLEGLTQYAASLAANRLPENPFLLLGQMTTADATRSPAGTESVWCYTHVPRELSLHGEALDGHVRTIERAIERNAPGFGDLVLARSVQSGPDLEAADANLHGGAIGGGTSGLHQQLVFRPTPGLSRAETVIDRLYLASSSAHPGGGVHGACGSNAARAALLRERRPSGRLRRAVLDVTLRRVYKAE